jgi:hypothetical protein
MNFHSSFLLCLYIGPKLLIANISLHKHFHNVFRYISKEISVYKGFISLYV